MKDQITIGTRGSRLAMAQAEAVAAALRQAGPGLRVHLRVISTEGDRVTAGPLPSWGRGVFVREIELALLREEIDLAVHSLKDVPAEVPPGLAIVAVPARAATGDVLVSPGPSWQGLSRGAEAPHRCPVAGGLADGERPPGAGIDSLPAGARVGTSSLRRAAFLRAYRSDLSFAPIRGNVDTRWRKLLDPSEGYDALVLAAAGLERLDLADVPRVPIPFDVLLPAPGQGALGLEARAADSATREVVAAINHPPSAAAVAAERRALRDLEGGCRLPVAALATPQDGGGLALAAAVAAPDGSRVIRHEARGTLTDPEGLGAAVASRLLALGATALLQESAPLEAAL